MTDHTDEDSDAGPSAHDEHEHHHPDDEEIDEALEETFPASDPPSFATGRTTTE